MFGERLRRLGCLRWRVVLAAAGVSFVVVRGLVREDVVTPRPTGAGAQVAVLGGDFNGDGKADIALTGGQGWNSIAVATAARRAPRGPGCSRGTVKAWTGRSFGRAGASSCSTSQVPGHRASDVRRRSGLVRPGRATPGGGMTQPPEAEADVGVLRVFTCATSGHAVSVWTNDTTAGGGFQKAGTLPFQVGPDGGCAAKDSQPLLYMPAAQHRVQVVVTDQQWTGCTADDPNTSARVVESRSITGNPAAAIETTTVGVGTDRTPFATNGLNQ